MRADSMSVSELEYNEKFKETNTSQRRFLPNNIGIVKYELEDYIYEMECRQNEGDNETQDIYSRLAQKEQDLILAAELGKALLERNELLSRENEKQAEEYSQRLEILEQDKHSLRRKLETTEKEYEGKVQELTDDLQMERGKLQDEKEASRQSDREKSEIIEELTKQNQRLTTQLKESSKKEEQLNNQIDFLRDQFNARKFNVSEQSSALQVLKDEISLLTERKLELERRVDILLAERENLSVNLDESCDRILMLERHSREQELLLRTSQRDMEDLRSTTLTLDDRLEATSRNSSSPSMGHTSLLNEMDMSDQEVSRPYSHPSLPEDLIELDEDIECDDPIMTPASDSESLKQLRQEVIEAVSQVKVIIDQMQHKRRNSLISLSTSSSDEFNASNLKPGLLVAITKELQGLVGTFLSREAQGGECEACGRSGSTDDRIQMEQEIHKALEAADRMTIEMNELKERFKSKTEEAAESDHKVILKEAELKAVAEERAILKEDLQNTHLAKDEIVKKAWDSRDSAVARKNACEIELAKTRIENMQLNSQLMEAVQQKVEISQERDQWQFDMQQLLDDQMRKKLHKYEMAGLSGRGKGNGPDSDSSGSGKLSPTRTSKLLALINNLKR